MTTLAKPNLVYNAAHLATLLFSFFIGVQLLVAVGIVPISILWGCHTPQLTPALCVTSVIAVFVLAVSNFIVAASASE